MWGGSVPMFCMSCSICSGLCIGLLCAACACSTRKTARAQQKQTQPCSHIADTLPSTFPQWLYSSCFRECQVTGYIIQRASKSRALQQTERLPSKETFSRMVKVPA